MNQNNQYARDQLLQSLSTFISFGGIIVTCELLFVVLEKPAMTSSLITGGAFAAIYAVPTPTPWTIVRGPQNGGRVH